MKNLYLIVLLSAGMPGFAQNAPIDFEPGGFGASWTWATFEAPPGESNPTFSVAANPAPDGVNGSANVGKMDISYATEANWGSAGCESMHGADLGSFSFTAQNSLVRMMVYQEGFASPVALKFATPEGAAFPEVVVANTVANAWVEVEFDITAWIGDPLGQPDQIIFFPSYAPRSTGHVVYFDNVVFGEQPPPAGDPMVSAPDPTIDESLVLSAYSETYATNTVTNFNLNAFQGGGVISEIDIENDGNLTLKIENLTFYGAQWDAVDVNAYDFVHLDYWSSTSTAFNFYLIDATAGIPGGNVAEPRFAFATSGGDQQLVQGQWNSVFIPLQHFLDYPSTGFNYDLNDIFQWKFDGSGNVFIDNVYFSKDPLSTTELDENSFKAFPNPSADFWTVRTETGLIHTVILFNILGQQVGALSPQSGTARIDASDLASGIYLAQITTAEGVATIRLIKE
jgi:hypothetical protein